MTQTICLNADIGELPGDTGRALDRAILDVVSRCNIACGGHAGDDESMRSTLRAARARNVAVGVHPSYPDRENFGRTTMQISAEDLAISLRQQVRTFLNIARDVGVTVAHLKPHGALYNDAARDAHLAGLIVRTAQDARITQLIGPPTSELSRAAEKVGLGFVAEGFADRRYSEDGSLVPRSEAGAVLTSIDEQISQTLQLVRDKCVTTRAGTSIDLHVQTICLHGDTTGAIHSAFAMREALNAHGISIEAHTS